MHNAPRVAGLIYGSDTHYLDHLAPLCALLQVPLIVVDETIYHLAKQFYPDLVIYHENFLALAEKVAANFDILFHCGARPLFDEVFFFTQKMSNKKIHTIWCPHGNSDKGHLTPHMEALDKEEVALVYGQKMIDFLKDKGVMQHLKGYAEVGNYRYQYYLKHKSFYESVVKAKITRRLAVGKKNIFYAPTWQDAEDSSSCFDMLPILLDKLPEQYNLIVRLHPNIILQHPFKIDTIIEDCADRAEVVFAHDFPPIYPLIDLIDIYIGDASSIGYDVAYMGKPMFLLNQNGRDALKDPGMYLFRCGVEIKKEQYGDIFKIISAYLPSDTSYFHTIRKEVSTYTFTEKKNTDALKDEISKLYHLFPDSDLNFY